MNQDSLLRTTHLSGWLSNQDNKICHSACPEKWDHAVFFPKWFHLNDLFNLTYYCFQDNGGIIPEGGFTKEKLQQIYDSTQMQGTWMPKILD